MEVQVQYKLGINTHRCILQRHEAPTYLETTASSPLAEGGYVTFVDELPSVNTRARPSGVKRGARPGPGAMGCPPGQSYGRLPGAS